MPKAKNRTSKICILFLGKSFEKQTEKQVGAVKSLKRFNNKKLLKTKWEYIYTKSCEWIGWC